MNETEDKILLERIVRFNDRLSKQIVHSPLPLALEFAKSDGALTFSQRKDLDYKPISVDTRWGQHWEVAWFRASVPIPETHRNKPIVVRLDLGGEGLVFDNQGRVLQGISSGSVFLNDFSRDLIHVSNLSSGQDKLELWIEASACGLFGVHTDSDPQPGAANRYGHYDAVVKAAELCLFDEERRALWLDIETVRGVLTELPPTSTRRARLAVAASETIDLFDREESVDECRRHLSNEYDRPASASELTAMAVGHAHIDTAWLWPVRESVRKCARTFASQLRLLERYPKYVFGASQPQHYQFVKTHYPELYKEISDAVKDGRWEVQGGMWVEADCNLISGESMIRQILHGKNFFQNEFGVDVKNLWLPDVFGYSAALPQILRKSGIEYFLTQKMSWNQYNKFPHHTFRWQGIDGSQVIAHFPPEDTYNASLRADSLIRGAAQYRERGIVDRFMTLFGVGDGGGGPKEEHIEFGRRCMDNEGIPKVQFGTAASFFENIERRRSKLPQWSGELYLELHRGTLTTQSRNKRWNRKLDYRLRATEMLWSCLDVSKYPSGQLTELWRTLLMNQFHDILPGSSITSVYERTDKEYDRLDKDVDALQHQATKLLGQRDPNAALVFNPSSYDYQGAITLPSDWNSATLEAAGDVVCQRGDRTEARIKIGPLQYATLAKSDLAPAETTEDSELVLENELIRYEFGTDGRLVRAFDKEAGREVCLSQEPANQLTLYADRPNNWDAWDIDRTYEQTAIDIQKPVSSPRRISGPILQTLIFDLRIGNSSIEQYVRLETGSKRLDFVTSINWQESHRMLRVAFPVNIRSDEASFDIQYGYVKRPTHRNTSWDLARFEAVAHRYADLSEPDYGVALLNDCKYGHKVVEHTLDLCLLRSPGYPDPDADRGIHRLTYSLLPHSGDLVRSDVMSQASALNFPPLVFFGTAGGDNAVPIHIDSSGATVETLKRAEKENCLIARIVETLGCRSHVTMRPDADITRIVECDLMEWQDNPDLQAADGIQFTLQPFEIKTFKLWRG